MEKNKRPTQVQRIKKYIEDLDMDALPEDGRKKLKNFLTLEFIKTRSKYNFSWKPRNW